MQVPAIGSPRIDHSRPDYRRIATPPRRRAAWALRLGLLVLATLAACPAHADSIRCGGSLASVGDPAVAVLSACGQPNFIDPWVGGAALTYGAALSMEEWTYNRGPGQLLQILVFRDGKLVRIRTGGYGFREGGPLDCRPADISPGISKYRLLQMCGEPAQSAVVGFLYSSRGRAGGQTYYLRRGVLPVFRERWIYNFGGNRLLREVTLENAVVVSVDTLDRGFDP